MFDTTQSAYCALRDILAEKTMPVIAWIGSGLSTEAGLPTWIQLQKSLESSLQEKIRTVSSDRKHLLSLSVSVNRASSPWLAFQLLREALGDTSYKEAIRENLRNAHKSPIPKCYTDLWRLGLNGIISLNLDRLAARAHSELHGGDQTLIQFAGIDVRSFLHVLKAPHPFILNLHGVSESEATWVLTLKELEKLKRSPGCQDFVTSCLATRTILFLGITADDISVGGYLEKLSKDGVDFGSHYWVTNRNDAQTGKWAEDCGLRLIRYKSDGQKHSALHEMLADLLRYMPTEDKPAPVAASRPTDPPTTLPPVGDLTRRSSEDIRQVLNSFAADVLSPQTQEAYTKYAKFSEQYDAAIYRAWYVSTKPPDNVLMGYRLCSEIARGGFGRVYEAKDKDEQEVAIKILHEDVRKNPEHLQSFRRGVRSMRILSTHNAQGMVPYLEAAEIPAFVVMELIRGPNLAEAVRSHYIEDWRTRLRVAVDLVRVIQSAHMLPERVLHRDIRPSNIMLKGYYEDPDQWKVVVLDFDLSWHIGANEQSILESSYSGYLAPEQVVRTTKASTRHAAVDSFGMGMTLYFLATGKDPVFAQHRHQDWSGELLRGARVTPCGVWVSLPNRYARLIEHSTKDGQAERWDMTQIRGELERLQSALKTPESVESAELVAEETVARTGYKDSYHWDEDELSASIALPTGMQVRLQGHESKRQLILTIAWESHGNEERRKVTKYLKVALEELRAILRKAGWDISSDSQWSGSLNITACCGIAYASKHIPILSRSLDAVFESLRLE